MLNIFFLLYIIFSRWSLMNWSFCYSTLTGTVKTFLQLWLQTDTYIKTIPDQAFRPLLSSLNWPRTFLGEIPRCCHQVTLLCCSCEVSGHPTMLCSAVSVQYFFSRCAAGLSLYIEVGELSSHYQPIIHHGYSSGQKLGHSIGSLYLSSNLFILFWIANEFERFY